MTFPIDVDERPPVPVRFNLLIPAVHAYSALHAHMLHKFPAIVEKASNPRSHREGYRMREVKELLDCARPGRLVVVGVLVSAMRMRPLESLTHTHTHTHQGELCLRI